MSYVVLVLLVYLVMYLAPRAGVHSQYRLKKHETFLDARKAELERSRCIPLPMFNQVGLNVF